MGAVFVLTRFSLVDLVADRNSLVRKSGVGGGGQNLILILSVELQKRKRKKLSGILIYFVSVACCCGLCVPNMIITKANVEENPGEFICLSIEANARANLQIFIRVPQKGV